jgi:formiminoglutamase
MTPSNGRSRGSGHCTRASCCTIAIRSARRFRDSSPAHFNIGTFAGASCAPELTARIERLCDGGSFSRVTNGRFKGGYSTRHYGAPSEGVHAVQMELACRGYLREPAGEVDESNWPCPWDEAVAVPLRTLLRQMLSACLAFASEAPR